MVGPIWASDQLVARPLPKHRTTQTQNKHIHTPNVHALCGIRTHDPGYRASEDSSCLRPLDYRDRQFQYYQHVFLQSLLRFNSRGLALLRCYTGILTFSLCSFLQPPVTSSLLCANILRGRFRGRRLERSP
jgi:hypothetical protein